MSSRARSSTAPTAPASSTSPLGKKSFDEQALVENYQAVLEEILRAKPSAAKGRYLQSITIASTMSPGVKLDTSKTRDLLEETTTAA